MTVYKNNRGKWCFDIEWVYPDGTAKRIRKTSPVQTRVGAEREERKTRDALSDGTYGVKEGEEGLPTVAEYEPIYMQWCLGKKSKASGMRNRECLFNRHLRPLFGKKRLDQFGASEQRELLARFAKLSNSRYNNAAAVMNKMLEVAYAELRPGEKSFKFSWLPKVERKMPFYDFDEYLKLMAVAFATGTRELCLLLLGADAGLRRGEIIALTVGKCNFKTRTVIVEEAEYILKGERNLDDTKGRNSRDVPMTDNLYVALRRHIPKGAKASDRVLLNNHGEPLINKQVLSIMARLQRGAGLEAKGKVHILRHTFCSHLAMRGVPVMTIKELAGHSKIETTLKYMHLAPGEKRRAMDALRPPSGNLAATATLESLN